MTDLHKFSDVSEKIDRAILIFRGRKVMIDSDLAEIFGVKTYRLNEQVKRNRDRFPDDFMFQLTAEEKQEVIANCDHLEKIKFSRTNPYAFTEHGTIMLVNVLNTLDLESKYDKQFELIFKAIRELMRRDQLDKNRPRIGYKIGKGK